MIVDTYDAAISWDVFGPGDGAPVHAVVGLLDGVGVAGDGVKADSDIEANSGDTHFGDEAGTLRFQNRSIYGIAQVHVKNLVRFVSAVFCYDFRCVCPDESRLTGAFAFPITVST